MRARTERAPGAVAHALHAGGLGFIPDAAWFPESQKQVVRTNPKPAW